MMNVLEDNEKDRSGQSGEQPNIYNSSYTAEEEGQNDISRTQSKVQTLIPTQL